MKTNENSIVNFRCKHRHSAFSHPKCYLKYLNGGELPAKLPKVLVFDIETSPLKAFVFQKSIWKANITDDQVISEWYMLCWSAKWLFDDEILSQRLAGREALGENDKRIVGGLWKLLDEADIVIAHNGDSFDIPNMNTRFIVQGYLPPSPYQTIDTKSVASKQFGFTHNSLDGLAKLFGLGEKKTTDFDLWKRCTDGDDEALEYMQEYNKGDVSLLEELYLKLRPWIKGHPNMGLYVDSTQSVCPNCGSTELSYTGKFYYTQTGKYETFRCKCGAFGRSRKSSVEKEVRENLVVGLAK
jgi:RNase H-like protein